MKLSIVIFGLLVVLVQMYLSESKLMEISSNNDDLKHVLNKRINGLWGKRLNNLWGKRSESDSDEIYQHLVQELYDHPRRNPFARHRLSGYNGLNPLTLEQLIAQRTALNDENENASENMS